MAQISIVIPLYNKEHHILDTLNSILAQTFQDFEILVINDGSTDASLENISSIKDDRLHIHTIKNQGVSYARNYGVGKATTELIAFLDGDDLWKPQHLEQLKNLYQRYPNCGLYATAYEHRFNGKTIPSVYHKIPTAPNWKGILLDFFDASTIHCVASSSSVMIPKTVYNLVGGFNTAYDSGEDTDLWIRLALRYDVAFSNPATATIIMSGKNQASLININLRKHMDVEAYPEEDTHPSLKMFLDLNRFSLALQYKLAGTTEKAQKLIQKIDLKNLNSKQRFLLQMNDTLLKKFMKLKMALRKNGIGLSAFR